MKWAGLVRSLESGPYILSPEDCNSSTYVYTQREITNSYGTGRMGCSHLPKHFCSDTLARGVVLGGSGKHN